MQNPDTPVAGVDYPRTFQEFDAWFGSEAACHQYLCRLRWPQGFVCPRCRSVVTPWVTGRGLLQCPCCQRQSSVTAGTLFEGTRKPLRTWFLTMWLITSQKFGASALGLQRVLGLGSYQTAWSWLHKLRRAMVRPGRGALCGEVEVDETFVGGVEAGGGRRRLGNKAMVAIAVEVRGRALGRIRLRRIPDASADSLLSFIKESIAPGSTVITDGWEPYKALSRKGYVHVRKVIRSSGQRADQLLPGVHQVASLMKRWLLGTHQGAVSREHLEYYLDEFTFRFNRRRSGARGMLFYRLLQQALAAEPTPYSQLVAPDAPHSTET